TIAFHAAFQSRNHLATATFASLCIVVATGLVGRFVYGLVPSAGGAVVELAMVRAELERERRKLPSLGENTTHRRIERLLGAVPPEPAARTSLFPHLVAMPFRSLSDWVSLQVTRSRFPSAETFVEFVAAYRRVRRLYTQVAFYRALRRFLSGWRAF